MTKNIVPPKIDRFQQILLIMTLNLITYNPIPRILNAPIERFQIDPLLNYGFWGMFRWWWMPLTSPSRKAVGAIAEIAEGGELHRPQMRA